MSRRTETKVSSLFFVFVFRGSGLGNASAISRHSPAFDRSPGHPQWVPGATLPAPKLCKVVLQLCEILGGLFGCRRGACWYQVAPEIADLLPGNNAGVTRIYRNDHGANFLPVEAGFPQVWLGVGAWSDHQRDPITSRPA
jgi:hypothetical protein